ncbi:MAG: RnfABCDGE type electron transport complex subunit B [Candidatus Omnitrophica bacterium]|nr:RnfABCDGE type electron transport complex subunit B [Candidatus Omnitrophota bacterium]MDD5592727.1 RnfABCDGE type electron transport complex subunit B [Candidatus Omnitrophota bacterium]
MEILIPILTLGVLGLLFGVGLALASKKLAVHVDARLEKIHGLLPGSNCGACGGAGCFGFAESVLSGKLKIDACRVSSDETKKQIAEALGRKLQKIEKAVAVLHCAGGTKVKDRFLYSGIEDCVAANLVLGGQKECVWGCLGFGSCVRVCPFDAIKMSDTGLPVVDKDKCKACNKCVLICPKKLFTLVPVTHDVYVACSSHDLGKDTRLVCPVGCIACRKCEQVCPVDAIHVIDNLAIIDYNKCTSCGKCIEVCPVKCIIRR